MPLVDPSPPLQAGSPPAHAPATSPTTSRARLESHHALSRGPPDEGKHGWTQAVLAEQLLLDLFGLKKREWKVVEPVRVPLGVELLCKTEVDGGIEEALEVHVVVLRPPFAAVQEALSELAPPVIEDLQDHVLSMRCIRTCGFAGDEIVHVVYLALPSVDALIGAICVVLQHHT
eukprot:CAMPEP_0180682834 /NCGR_PEP_ID=MMETSP1037_2-20121125/70785_1 /TAXON_ID=632150 /ORGANISM="Azadinium spinosum, Strain 3D9" /LENGTH=173 /DNA_ID=CAMNT_0022712887 /DNA_START=44 /DNA_END=563 /DNA_ORIENTATION=-